ncbi:hypothetical protein BJX61DRAFT_526845 [Aspergillus egyptiacus]|nr:hypothetical protein BJX61DRAFT_526845 [Aspergillus egyptiacus]
MPSYPDNRIDVTNWATPLDPGPFTTAPVSSAASIATPCTPDLNLTAQGTLQDYTTAQPYTATLPSNHSSPSISEPSLPDHIIPTNPSVNAKMKPNRATKAPIRCWEHSCGGRAFSSLGNYERHLREKSGRAKSFTCEQCGQRFTRSTAKNKHIRYGRCRVRPLIQ